MANQPCSMVKTSLKRQEAKSEKENSKSESGEIYEKVKNEKRKATDFWSNWKNQEWKVMARSESKSRKPREGEAV